MDRIGDMNSAAQHLVDICERRVINPEDCRKINATLIKLLRCIENKAEEADHQTETERKRIGKRIGDFNYKDSQAFAEMKKRKLNKRSQKELVSIAQVIGKKYNIVLDREAKRRKLVLYKWFEENLDIVRKGLNCMELITEE